MEFDEINIEKIVILTLVLWQLPKKWKVFISVHIPNIICQKDHLLICAEQTTGIISKNHFFSAQETSKVILSVKSWQWLFDRVGLWKHNSQSWRSIFLIMNSHKLRRPDVIYFVTTGTPTHHRNQNFIRNIDE